MKTEPVAAGVKSPRRTSDPQRARARRREQVTKNTQPSGAQLAALRVLDLVVAAIMLAVLAMPMLVLALLIRFTSRGPAMYRQERIGTGGRPFMMYKFRTMRVDAEDHTGPVWATRDDPRRTLLGALLRRLSIDELPQLFNIMAGDMSLVGPRPERPFFVQKFSKQFPAYPQRHQVRPGLTGWAQINGWRGDTSIEKRLEHDLIYIRRRSLIFNVRILLLTPLKVLVEQNAC